MKIRTQYSITQLKQQSTSFKKYLMSYKVHINNAHHDKSEGVTMGWIWKYHPSLSYKGEIKYRPKALLEDVSPDLDYDIFPKKKSYK